MQTSYKVRSGARKISIFAILFLASLFLFGSNSKPNILNLDADKSKNSTRIPLNVLYNYTNIVRKRVHEVQKVAISEFLPELPILFSALPVVLAEARPFLRMKSWYRIAPKYKLSGCIVEKSMCTIVQGIMCYLFDSEGFVKARRSIATEPWERRFCGSRNEPGTTIEKKLLMPYNTTTLFVVRDPIERFLSGFVDKCVREGSSCFGCKGKVLCAIDGLSTELLKMTKFYPNIIVAREKMIALGYEAQHMAPQSWYCDLFDEYKNYIFVRYGERGEELESMHRKLIEILRDHGVEEKKLEHIRKSISKHTQHTTKNNPVRESLRAEIDNSPKHLEKLMRLYKYDYELFGFKSPIKV